MAFAVIAKTFRDGKRWQPTAGVEQEATAGWQELRLKQAGAARYVRLVFTHATDAPRLGGLAEVEIRPTVQTEAKQGGPGGERRHGDSGHGNAKSGNQHTGDNDRNNKQDQKQDQAKSSQKRKPDQNQDTQQSNHKRGSGAAARDNPTPHTWAFDKAKEIDVTFPLMM